MDQLISSHSPERIQFSQSIQQPACTVLQSAAGRTEQPRVVQQPPIDNQHVQRQQITVEAFSAEAATSNHNFSKAIS
jgi:hypothetical protein